MDILVSPLAHNPSQGLCQIKARRARCALGHKGCTKTKREGDGKTPYGRFLLRRLWYRADRLRLPYLPRNLPHKIITRKSLWSDDPQDPAYNRAALLPHAFHHERLWRHDQLYDVFFELGFNDDPPIAGKGSAIFLHRANMRLTPTQGCIAIALPFMLYLVQHARKGDALVVRPPAGGGQTPPLPT